jgi:ABC-type glycerol-3-phosphate transport system substrate-binding protein
MTIINDDRLSYNAIHKFNRTYSNAQIEYKEVAREEYYSQKYKDKLTAEILAGEGPDIFSGSTYMLPSIYKAAQNGTFYDLNKLIKKDKQFKVEDYYGPVMDSGLIDGKRYLVPVNFGVNVFYTYGSVLKNNNLQIDEKNFSWDVLSKMSAQFTSQNKEKYFFNLMDFTTLVESSGLDLVDYKSKKANFDSKEFIKLLKTYKEITPAVCPADVLTKYKGFWWGLAKDNKLVLLNSYLSNPSNFWTEYNFAKNALNSDVKIYSYPTISGNEKTAATVKNFAAISSKCKHKNEAFDFIKILLSEEIQNNTDLPYIPVNKEAYKKMIDFYSNKDNQKEIGSVLGDNKRYQSVPFSKEFADTLDGLPDKVETSYFWDGSVYTIIDNEMKDYMSDKKTAEQTAKSINDKVLLFLNE